MPRLGIRGTGGAKRTTPQLPKKGNSHHVKKPRKRGKKRLPKREPPYLDYIGHYWRIVSKAKNLDKSRLKSKKPCQILHTGFMINLRDKSKPETEGQGLFVMNDYTEKKAGNQAVLPFISKHVSAGTRERIKDCGGWLQMAATRDLEKKKVHRANFCKNRFCPMCSWRKSKKEAVQVKTLMQYIRGESKKAFILLTLTAPNVKADKLRDEITKFNEAFKRLTKRKEILPVIKGYVRKLEVTYNEKRDDYHPHFHCILAVNKSYFSDRTYLSQAQWLNLWREAMRDSTITQVDLRRVKEDPHDINKDVQQVAIYSAKTVDLTASQEVFDVLYKALTGRQLLTFNGLFKDATKLYKAKELDYLKEADETPYELLLLYQWGYGSYVEKERRELTEEERRDLRREIMDEDDDE